MKYYEEPIHAEEFPQDEPPAKPQYRLVTPMERVMIKTFYGTALPSLILGLLIIFLSDHREGTLFPVVMTGFVCGLLTFMFALSAEARKMRPAEAKEDPTPKPRASFAAEHPVTRVAPKPRRRRGGYFL